MKKLNLFLLLIAFSFGLFAVPVSIESARSVADNFYTHYSVKSNVAVSDVITYQKEGVNTFYVFVYEAGGFVIISADDAVIPILGYSTTEPFDKNNIPVNAASWLNDYNDHIKYIINKNLSNKETLKEWNKIKNNQFEKSLQAVNPLCTTTWDQDSPYNNLCPSGSMTGCVATAMAQVMKYWNYPTTGVGTHTYTDATYGAQTANFGATTYMWANMPNNLTVGSTAAQKAAVSTLMYHCGVSVNMAYSPSGSGAYSTDVPPSLINYFNYSPSAEIQFLANFTTANWINMLKTELDASRPVYYSGSGTAGGHAFVCDGYDASNKFHFNWGWSGSANGYFAIGSLTPYPGESFNTDNSAVIRIKPPSSAPIANFVGDNHTPVVGGYVNFTDLSTNSPTTWSWIFEGGTPSTSTLQNPTNIVYNTAGVYQVTLTVTNTNGNDTKTRASYIDAGGTPSAWIKQNSGFATASRGIDQIFIVNPYIVWAKAYDGSGGAATIQEFTRTTNGGLSWTPDTITADVTLTDFGIANLFPFNDTVCFAAMFPAVAATGGYVVKTTDGGVTWLSTNTPNFSTSWLDLVHFFNANEGLCMGDPAGTDFVIFRTTDGGNTWTQVPVANLPNCLSAEAGITNMYDAFGDNIWFGTTKGRVYRSTDKGVTWTVTATGLTTSSTVTPVFKDALNGIVTGTQSATPYAYLGMRKTNDGGATWTTITPTGFYVKSPDIDFVPGTTSMWVDCSASLPSATTNMGSAYSLDDCATFLDIDTGSTQYTTVTFYDINTGWAGGFNENSTLGGIYKWDSSILMSVPKTNNETTDEIRVYPNPTQDMINIEFSVVPDKKVVVNLYNILGENVLSKEITSNTNIAQLNLAGNKSGIYFLSINNGSKMITKRISLVE